MDSENVDQIACDCLVIGGGPAGSVSSSIVAEAGYDVVMIERATHPRPHVGESLMPATNEVIQRLQVKDRIAELNFLRKVGVQFVNAAGKASKPFFFRKHDDSDESETWHVDRAKLDHCLFDNAAEKGVRTMEAVRFLQMDTLDTGKHSVTVSINGQKRVINPRVVIDASGQQSVLANHFKIKQLEERRKNISIWTYYESANHSFSDEAVTIIAKTAEANGWFWLIPVGNKTLSVGLVGEVDRIHSSGSNNEERFKHFVDQNEFVRNYLDSLELTRSDDFIAAKDFSYKASQPAGDGWVLAGDALGFIDPVYSTGVLLALKTGELAGDAVVECLEANDFSQSKLGAWYPKYQEKVSLLRQLVDLFYDPDFSFGEFIAANPDYSYQLADLLMGRVFGRDDTDFFERVSCWKNSQLS